MKPYVRYTVFISSPWIGGEEYRHVFFWEDPDTEPDWQRTMDNWRKDTPGSDGLLVYKVVREVMKWN